MSPHEQARRNSGICAEDVLVPSRSLTPDQRLRIYSEAYLARLIETLEEDYPAVLRAVGHRPFHELCRAYLERYPSRHWSLNPLGRRLPEFLLKDGKTPRRKAARDLARVEAAMSEVFDAPSAEPLRPGDFAKLPPARWGGARLDFVPAFRLLHLDYHVNPYLDAVRQKRTDLPALRRRRSWTAVYRKEFKVWRLDLEEPAYAGLSALHRGCTLAEAVRRMTRRPADKPSAWEGRIRQWFGEWVTEGFFSAVRR